MATKIAICFFNYYVTKFFFFQGQWNFNSNIDVPIVYRTLHVSNFGYPYGNSYGKRHSDDEDFWNPE